LGSVPVYDDNGNALGSLTVGEEYKVLKSVEGYVYISYQGGVGKISILTNVLVDDKTPCEAAADSKKLADSISDGISSLGLIRRNTVNDNLYVTRMTNMTSMLVEIGFVSNPVEREKLVQDSFQKDAADEIAKAIIDFYKDKDY
jgi:N-acetylmuramoyl-L-alanine amidase